MAVGDTTPARGRVCFNKTINDLTRENFAGLLYTGRLELDASAVTGTRSEATAGAQLVIRTAEVQAPAGAISVEFSPVGAFARGFVRSDDGREAALPGVEGGVNASLMVNIGRLGIGMRARAWSAQTGPTRLARKPGRIRPP